MDEKIKTVSAEEELRIDNAKEKAKPILRKFFKAKNAIGERNTEQMENMAFYEGKQYQLSKYKVSRPWVVRMRTPYSSTAVDTRVSSLISSDYTGVLVPMSPEDEEDVKVLSDFIHDEWERMDLNNKVNECIKTSAIVRESYIHCIWKDEKFGKGRTAREGYMDAYAIDTPSSVYIDPTALCLKDARYVQVLARKTFEELEEEYPSYAEGFRVGGGFMPEDRGEIYLGKDYSVEQEDVRTVITHYEKVKGHIKKSVVVGDVLVHEVDLDGVTQFPIAQMRWKRASGSPYGLALMDEVLDLQKAVNSIESSITNTAMAYSTPSYGIRKGSGISPDDLSVVNGAPGLIVMVEGNIDEAIKPLALPKLDQSILGVKSEYIGAIDRIAGITNPYLGSIGTSGNTAQGAKMALERARIIEADVLHNIELFVQDLVSIISEYLTSQHAGEKVMSRRYNKSTNKADFKEYKLAEDIAERPWTFFVNLSAKTAYSKEREKEKLIELFQMERQYKAPIQLINQLDVLEAYDVTNQEVLVERYNRLLQQSNEEKTQLVMQITKQAAQLGIPDEMVQPAIIEIIEGGESTPVADKLMAIMKQKAQETAQKQQEGIAQFTQNVTQAGVAPSAIQSMVQQMQGGGQPSPSTQSMQEVQGEGEV